ncbi:MAG: hypothetical protein H0U23_07625 [Blastocatellia bacterium]|nr:hypothetical protein [Blastocatellia bacterium]
MAFDWSDDIAGALEDIAEFGRVVSFVKFKTTTADPDKPLEGPAAPIVEALVTGVSALFVEPSSVVRLGSSTSSEGLWKSSLKIALVGYDGVNDWGIFDRLTDTDLTEWKIQHVDKLQPGSTPILFFVGLAR